MDVTVSEGVYKYLNMKSSRKGEVLSVSTVNRIVTDALNKPNSGSEIATHTHVDTHRYPFFYFFCFFIFLDLYV